MHLRRDRREHRRAERARLIRRRHLDRQVEHIRAELHHERGFAADPADRGDRVDRNPFRTVAFDDRARTVGGAFGQRPVDHRGGRTEVQPEDRPREVLVRVGGAAAVEPVHRHHAGGAGRNRGGFGFELRQRDVAGIAEQPLEPRVHVAEGGLSRFQPDKPRHHRAVDLPADAFHALRDFGGDQNVAGGGADHLDQFIRLDLRADRPEMAVEGAAADHHVRGKPELRGPLRRKRADRNVGGAGFGVKPVAKPGQQRVDSGEELLGGQPAPACVPHRLVPGGAAAADHGERLGAAGQFAGDPVAVLDPAVRGGADLRIDLQRVQDLAPEPFARIDAPFVDAEIGPAPACGILVDPGRLGDRGVVLPQNEHRVGVVGELRFQRERRAVTVHRARGRAGGVDRDAGDAGSILPLERAFDHRLDSLKVIERVLAESVVRGVAVSALRPAGVIVYAGGELLAVFGDQHGADAVGAEIKTDQ